jgi:hypothetical protein
VTPPLAVESVVGMERVLGLVTPQTVDNVAYAFTSWSDGGEATHTIATPAADATYTATFRGLAPLPGLGLAGTYWDNEDFTGFSLQRLDLTVAFDWGTAPPAMRIGADTFSVRWVGQVRPKVTGTHTFFTLSDGGIRLWVDGALLIDNFADHPPVEDSGAIALVAGQRYDIRIDYHDGTGTAAAQLRWSAPGLPKELVTRRHLHPYELIGRGLD